MEEEEEVAVDDVVVCGRILMPSTVSRGDDTSISGGI